MPTRYRKIILFIKTPVIIGVLMLLCRCENDIQQVQKLTAKQDSAIVSMQNVDTRYTLNGIPKVQVKAPEVNRFIEEDSKSYIEFPKGISLTFYDDSGKVSSTLTADYSIYYENEGIWEAKYNVEAVNEKGEKLNTEYLVWNRDQKKISSNQFVKMTTSSGIWYGDGFVSDEKFDSWELVNMRGTINLDSNE